MNYPQARDFLFSLRNKGSTYGIDRMDAFVRALGRPDEDYPIVHIAGTNGKGSTAAMLECLFRSAGYRTGLFTSPHLLFLGERIQVDRVPLSEESITELTAELNLQAAAMAGQDEDIHPTFFEFMTAMAMVCFSVQAVDIAFFETGLGGRKDATNVVDPLLSVITSIGLDHVSILGDTVEKIAREKAGIIKPTRPVVLGRVPRAARKVICRIARERGAEVFSVEDCFGEEVENYPTTNLHGAFQRWNAATAVTVCQVAEKRFPRIAANPAAALHRVDWPGRWQKISLPCGRVLILDATHNSEGCHYLEENLALLERESGQKPWIVAGTLGDFRARFLVPAVQRHARGLYLLEPRQPRAASFAMLRRWLETQPGYFSYRCHGGGPVSQERHLSHRSHGGDRCRDRIHLPSGGGVGAVDRAGIRGWSGPAGFALARLRRESSVFRGQ